MNIEEARKVLWLKSNPRPLGDLLDEGYLTRDRLEWAAQSAYSPKLKEAAAVIISNMSGASKNGVYQQNIQSGIEIGISLDQARTTPWPLPPYKGQLMGPLVDSKQLSLKDLGFAVENAWDEKVRKAAVVLSLVRLEQAVKEPAPSAGFVKVVSGGRSYAQRMQNGLILLEGFLFGIVMTCSIILLISQISISRSPGKPLPTDPYIITFVIIVFLVMVLLLWLVLKIFDLIIGKMDQKIEEHRLGDVGEERAVQLIVQALDGNWSLFRNVKLPGKGGDLDIVLVGPPGVWTLEVKNFNGVYRNNGETWEYQRGNRWASSSSNPSRQVKTSAARLSSFLNADNIKTFVNPAVVWANEETQPFVENPSVAVWLYKRLPDELGNIWQGEKLSKDERQKINMKLTKLCQDQGKKSN